MTLKIVVFGISGKMGQKVKKLALEDPQFDLLDGFSRNSSDFSLLEKADVAIDFSLQEGFQKNLEAAIKYQTPLVIGTTALSSLDQDLMQEASSQIPIFRAANFSLGIALLKNLSQKAQRALPLSEAQIIDTHHVHKKDAPSGTAIELKEELPEATIHSVREGEVIGRHQVIFELEDEKIELTHTALSRDLFAKGALRAAVFLEGKEPNLYSMNDLLEQMLCV